MTGQVGRVRLVVFMPFRVLLWVYKDSPLLFYSFYLNIYCLDIYCCVHIQMCMYGVYACQYIKNSVN